MNAIGSRNFNCVHISENVRNSTCPQFAQVHEWHIDPSFFWSEILNVLKNHRFSCRLYFDRILIKCNSKRQMRNVHFKKWKKYTFSYVNNYGFVYLLNKLLRNRAAIASNRRVHCSLHRFIVVLWQPFCWRVVKGNVNPLDIFAIVHVCVIILARLH